MSIKDENWEPEFFTLVSGSFEGSIAEIPSYAALRPLFAFVFAD